MHAPAEEVHAQPGRLLHSKIQTVFMVMPATATHAPHRTCMVFFCCALSGCIALLDCNCQTVTSLELSWADGWDQTMLSCAVVNLQRVLHQKHIAWANCSVWVSGILPSP